MASWTSVTPERASEAVPEIVVKVAISELFTVVRTEDEGAWLS